MNTRPCPTCPLRLSTPSCCPHGLSQLPPPLDSLPRRPRPHTLQPTARPSPHSHTHLACLAHTCIRVERALSGSAESCLLPESEFWKLIPSHLSGSCILPCHCHGTILLPGTCQGVAPAGPAGLASPGLSLGGAELKHFARCFLFRSSLTCMLDFPQPPPHPKPAPPVSLPWRPYQALWGWVSGAEGGGRPSNTCVHYRPCLTCCLFPEAPCIHAAVREQHPSRVLMWQVQPDPGLQGSSTKGTSLHSSGHTCGPCRLGPWAGSCFFPGPLSERGPTELLTGFPGLDAPKP